jgi:hypothetical protein
MSELAIELALDDVEARIAAELPPHVAAFAQAYAANRTLPPAPSIIYAPSTLAIARRAIEGGHVERGRALLRLGALVAIDADPAVARVRNGATWDDLRVLARARDAASQRLFGRGFLDVAHDVHGVTAPLSLASIPAPDLGDHTRALVAPMTPASIASIYGKLAPTPPTVIFGSTLVHPRTFVVRTGREVIVVLPVSDGVASVRAWSQALHELGHAVSALAGHEPSRVVDEAAAFASAARLEKQTFVSSLWPEIDAGTIVVAARRLHERQHATALRLAALEAALYAGDAIDALVVAERPAAALWHDPGAQAAYVAARNSVG